MYWLVLFFCIAFSFGVFVTFSEKMNNHLGLDLQESFTAIVKELKPAGIRLVAYWDLIQSDRDKYLFENLDWQMRTAEAAKIQVILTIAGRNAITRAGSTQAKKKHAKKHCLSTSLSLSTVIVIVRISSIGKWKTNRSSTSANARQLMRSSLTRKLR